MNKSEFVDFIAKQQNSTKVDAEKIINAFTTAVTELLGKGEEIALTGFGKFYTTAVEAKEGRNPQTGKSMQIPARTDAKFKAGQSLKDACNK